MNEKTWVTPVITVSEDGNAIWYVDGSDWHSQPLDAN